MISGTQASVAEVLRERYRVNRGRRCEKCAAPLAYDRPFPFCTVHEAEREASILARGQKRGTPLPGLRPLLRRWKVSIVELAEATGVSCHHLGAVAGQRKNASDECIDLIADALGVEPAELVLEEEG